MIALLLLLSTPDEGAANIDQEVRVSLRGGVIAVELAVQLGRQAAFAEALTIDADKDGRLSAGEQARYFAALEESIRAGLELRIEGRDVPLRRAAEPRLEMPFRKIYRFEAERGGGRRVELHNENFPDAPGEITLSLEDVEGADVVADEGPRDLVLEATPGDGRVERRPLERALPPGPPSPWILGGAALGVAAFFAARKRPAAALLAALAIGGLALWAGRPSDVEAERIFLALHEAAEREADPSLRRVKPLETRIEGGLGREFRVRHRWRSYGTLAHEGHAHARAVENEGRFTVRWSAGAWRLLKG